LPISSFRMRGRGEFRWSIHCDRKRWKVWSIEWHLK
jgi:hypothetical protein